MSNNTDKIKKIIMALLAKANGTDNENEAAAFLAKANEMLQQYQLDIADIVDAGDPILNHVGLKQASSGHAWRWRLYSKVAQLYGCKSIHVEMMVPGKNGKLVPGYEQRAVGRESAVITTDLMYPYIVGQVKAAAKRLAPITGMSEQGQAKRVAAALITRIASMLIEQEAAKPETAAGRNALLILDQVSAKYDELYPDTVTIRNNRSVSDGLSRDAANSISLHRQTGGGSTLKLGHG